MQYLKKLLLSRSYFDRVPDQAMIVDNGERYERVLATKGKDYALFYVYNGREFTIAGKKLGFTPGKANWFNPRTGEKTWIPGHRDTINLTYDPPGEKKSGNDWVLILEK